MCAVGCYHDGEIKTERGIVLDKQFAPEINTSSTGIGFTTGGHMAMTTSHIYIPEQYLVFFRCEHKVIFHVDAQPLWEKLNAQDSVYIKYYEILDRKNRVQGLKFVTANKITN